MQSFAQVELLTKFVQPRLDVSQDLDMAVDRAVTPRKKGAVATQSPGGWLLGTGDIHWTGGHHNTSVWQKKDRERERE